MNKLKLMDDIMEVFANSPSKDAGDIELTHSDYDTVYIHISKCLDFHINSSVEKVVVYGSN